MGEERTCRNCDATIQDTQKFCRECGVENQNYVPTPTSMPTIKVPTAVMAGAGGLVGLVILIPIAIAFYMLYVFSNGFSSK